MKLPENMGCGRLRGYIASGLGSEDRRDLRLGTSAGG